jgi:hypothetical protein
MLVIQMSATSKCTYMAGWQECICAHSRSHQQDHHNHHPHTLKVSGAGALMRRSDTPAHLHPPAAQVTAGRTHAATCPLRPSA